MKLIQDFSWPDPAPPAGRHSHNSWHSLAEINAPLVSAATAGQGPEVWGVWASKKFRAYTLNNAEFKDCHRMCLQRSWLECFSRFMPNLGPDGRSFGSALKISSQLTIIHPVRVFKKLTFSMRNSSILLFFVLYCRPQSQSQIQSRIAQ